jgi:integrase
MAVRKRGNVWYYDFMIKGVRYREAIPEARVKWQAQQAEAQARRDVFQGKYGKPTGERQLAEFVKNEYLAWSKDNKLSWRSDESYIKAICDFFGKKCFREITPMLIEKYKKSRREADTVRGHGRSAASVNKELQCLSRMFNMAIDSGLTDTNPCRKVKQLREDNRRNRYLSLDEESKLFAAFSGERAYLRPILVVALNTGMRRGEILGLKWSEVDFLRDAIYLTKTKTGKAREVPMNDNVRNELLALHGLSSEFEHVFVNAQSGEKLNDFKKAFAAARLEAGIPDFRFHDCRHTAATRMADAGIDPFTIAEILGHASLQMTRRYTHTLDRNKREAVNSLSKYAENNCLKFVTNKERQAV